MNIADAAAFVGLCGAGVIGIKVIIDGAVRFATLRRTHTPANRIAAIEQRLEQLTIAIDAVAVELERQGELQRFAAHLALGEPTARDAAHDPARPVNLIPTARPITPH